MVDLTGITWLEHTTDAEYSVEAPTLARGFELCGLALEHTMVNIESIGDTVITPIKAKGKDLQSLLYDYLEQFIILMDSKNLLISSIFIPQIEKTKRGYKLLAHTLGEIYDPSKHETKTAIKSPTYHAMSILRIESGYRIHFLLDL